MATTLPGPSHDQERMSRHLVGAVILELAANLAAREVSRSRVGRGDAVIGVDVHVGVARPDLPEGVGKVRDASRTYITSQARF